MNAGTVRIDEDIWPVDRVTLGGGRLQVRCRAEVTAGTLPRLLAVRPDTMVMVYGPDGLLVVRALAGPQLPSRLRCLNVRPGDIAVLILDITITGKVTNEVRARERAA